MEKDDDYASEVTDPDEFRVLDIVSVIDTITGKTMNPVNGSFKSGSYMYFYGGGSMKLARMNESTKEIREIISGTDYTKVDQIIYFQPSSMKGAVILNNGNVEIIKFDELKVE